MKIFFGHPEVDGPGGYYDTDTGVITRFPGNRGGGPNSYQDLARATHALKTAAAIKDDELRAAVMRPAGQYIETALAALTEAKEGAVAIL